MSTEAKKQHWVQRAYLEQFAGAEHLWVYDLVRAKTYRNNVRDLASGRRFYDITQFGDEPELRRAVETRLQAYENVGLAALRRLCAWADAPGQSTLAPDIRVDLSLYLAVQHLRTPHARERLVQFMLAFRREEFLAWNDATHPDSGISRENFSLHLPSELEPLHHARYLLDSDFVADTASHIHDKIWIVLENQSPLAFYTSDNPLTLRRQVETSFPREPGLNTYGVELTFPITPRLLLQMLDRVAFEKLKNQDGVVILLPSPANVEYFRSLQVLGAIRQVYSASEDLDQAREMKEAEPRLGVDNSPQVVVQSGEANSTVMALVEAAQHARLRREYEARNRRGTSFENGQATEASEAHRESLRSILHALWLRVVEFVRAIQKLFLRLAFER